MLVTFFGRVAPLVAAYTTDPSRATAPNGLGRQKHRVAYG
jgi:hypothetical protein